MENTLVKELAIPVVAFGVGAMLLPSESTAVPGKLAMFFGAQTVMNLYMKEVLSNTVISEEEDLKGIPSAFAVTAIQQLVAFVLFGAFALVSQLTPRPYSPKQLSGKMEYLAVLLFSFSFTMNIALNNYSISLLPLSVNLIIRSCLPLATFISQRTAAKCTGESVKDASVLELSLMCAGVACAAVAVVASSNGSGNSDHSSASMLFGILVCVLSLFSGAVNLALAGVLGTSVSLNPLDTTVYMSVPAFLILCVPSFLYAHPVWDGRVVTDVQVLLKVWGECPHALALVGVSGILSLFYNVFQYGIVQSLSASYTAFAGNFNKAATIALGILVGLEQLPGGPWSAVLVIAVLGNIGAFTAFNFVKLRAKSQPPVVTATDTESDSEEDSDSGTDDDKVKSYNSRSDKRLLAA